MTRNHAVLVSPLLVALLAVAFCVWAALGNDLNFCVTEGCALYQDFTLFGVSLWWFGAASFMLLAACAILGQKFLGARLAWLFLFGDACLLALMALTAPCVSCLCAALFFAAVYLLFRRHTRDTTQRNASVLNGWPILFWLWLALFVANVGQVAKSQINVWPILDESGEARTRMFFSPSCRFCIDGINALSGRVDVAFYPVADNEQDFFRIARMADLLSEGRNLAEALAQSADAQPGKTLDSLSPRALLLRFRLLRNKASVLLSGSRGVPFFEYRGLPPDIQEKSQGRAKKPAPAPDSAVRPEAPPVAPRLSSAVPVDPALPPELQDMTQCAGKIPCPPAAPQ